MQLRVFPDRVRRMISAIYLRTQVETFKCMEASRRSSRKAVTHMVSGTELEFEI